MAELDFCRAATEGGGGNRKCFEFTEGRESLLAAFVDVSGMSQGESEIFEDNRYSVCLKSFRKQDCSYRFSSIYHSLHLQVTS